MYDSIANISRRAFFFLEVTITLIGTLSPAIRLGVVDLDVLLPAY